MSIRLQISKIKATFCYIAFIVIINTSFPYFPFMTIAHTAFSSADMIIGVIYVLRDFAQREIKHYVILAMLIGAGASYLLADKAIAIASLCSFIVGETIDWGIYTYTGKPLSQRILWSSAISAPIDSTVFLAIYGPFNLVGISVITSSKVIGVLVVWYLWRRRARADAVNALA
jgi:queuosine precursor transporter